jgi:hypothetical protein
VPLTADVYPIDLTVYNSQDFPITYEDVGSIVVHQAGDAVTDVTLDDYTLAPGETTNLNVLTTDGNAPSAKVGGINYNQSAFSADGANPNLFHALITAPASDAPLETFAVDVNNNDFRNAARLVVRTTNSPVDDIGFESLHFTTGGGTTSIDVTMNEFTYGEPYYLKVVSNPEAGNFNALDFRYVWHPPDYTWNHGANDSAADYYDNLSGTYPGEIHIGDIIKTQPGNMSAVQTEHALDERIGSCTHTFETWEADGKPADCGRLVTVPIVEHIEHFTGKTDVIVYAIAEFFLESYEKVPGDKFDITGRFIQYAHTGTYQDDPPDSGLYMETVRLDRSDY